MISSYPTVSVSEAAAGITSTDALSSSPDVSATPDPPVRAVPISGDTAAENAAFGIDAFTLDDRLRLFHFAAAEKRHEYLWLLRAFDRPGPTTRC